MNHGGLDNGYDVDEIVDEQFIGDTFSDDNNGSYSGEFIEEVEPPPEKVQRFTAYVGAAVVPPVSLKRLGRPPKAEMEKKRRAAQPKGAIRISLTPKAKGPRGRPPSLPQSVNQTVDSSSPFPVIQLNNVVKKTPGRPRIHPPKDPSEKKPRGRPRKIPLEGEKAWRTECAKLRRLVKKKDELIMRMKMKLNELGATVSESPEQPDSDENDDAENGGDGIVGMSSDVSAGGLNDDAFVDVNADLDIGVTEETVVPSNMEDSHQTYVNMFAAVSDTYHSDCAPSNDDDDDETDSNEEVDDDDD